MPTATQVLGVILAGGLARRMGGGDKCLLSVEGEPILAHILRRLRPQSRTVILNANGDARRFDEFDVEVVADAVADTPGPLGGVLTGMEWARVQQSEVTHVVTVAGDTPFFPLDLVPQLCAALDRGGPPIAIAATRSGGDLRDQPTFGLWPVDRAGALRQAIVDDGVRKILDWADAQGCVRVEFAAESHDPFFNVNTPDDLKLAAAQQESQS